jgi:hypothetical protein
LNTDLEVIFNKIKDNIKKYKMIENIIIFTSIIAANFAAYIAYFDISVFMFIDSNAIINHTFGIVILFSFISASLTIFLIFLQNILLVRHENILFISIITVEDPDNSKVYNLLNNKFLKYIIAVIIFSFLYIGKTNTLYVLGSFFLFFIFIFIIDLLREYRDPFYSEDELLTEMNKIKYIKILPNSFKKTLRHAYTYDYILKKEMSILYKDGKSFQIVLSRLGIMLITLSLLVGIGKANFVEKNNLVCVSSRDKNISNLVLFLSTNNGICTFDEKSKLVEFIPWGNIEKVTFLSENPYSIHKLIPQESK